MIERKTKIETERIGTTEKDGNIEWGKRGNWRSKREKQVTKT